MNPCRPDAELRAPIFQNQGSFPHATEVATQVTHILTAVKVKQKISI